MNLKLVAAMSVLGLVSCPVFAATDANTTNVKHKHHHHKVMKHHHVAEMETEAHPDYKGMGTLPVAPEVCSISQNAMIMDSMTQNMGRAMPNPCNPGWFNRINISGGANFDAGKWGNNHNNQYRRYMGQNYKHFSLNDAYVNVSANVNDWAKAFMSISYNDATQTALNSPLSVFNAVTNGGIAEYSAAYSDNINGNGNKLNLEQGFVTIGNLDQMPVFLQVGKQFQDFGRYEIHPITRPMTQSMSETLATSAKLGFVANGFNGSVYGFDDPTNKVSNSIGGNSRTSTNYGFALGYDQPSDQLGFDLGVGYINNLIGVNDIAYIVAQNNGAAVYNRRASGLAAYGDVNSGPFSVAVRYVTALQDFSSTDLGQNVTLVVPPSPILYYSYGHKRKPWSAGIMANYGFEAFDCRTNNIYVGYDASRKAEGLALPKNRWTVGYNIDVWKWTNLGLEWNNDQGYKHNQHHFIDVAGFVPTYHHSHKNTNLVSLRAAVKFG